MKLLRFDFKKLKESFKILCSFIFLGSCILIILFIMVSYIKGCNDRIVDKSLHPERYAPPEDTIPDPTGRGVH